MKVNKLSQEDLDLFHQATRLVKPLVRDSYIEGIKHKKTAAPNLLAKRKNAQYHHEEPYLASIDATSSNFYDDEINEYVQIGCGNDLIRKLKKGKWPVEASLDLHGFNLENAQINLDRFIAYCIDNNIRCVRIIHGKGIGSPSGKPILKSAVRQHISRLKSVQAWVQGKDADGGSGALIALLKLKK